MKTRAIGTVHEKGMSSERRPTLYLKQPIVVKYGRFLTIYCDLN